MIRATFLALIVVTSVFAAPAADEVKSLKDYYNFTDEFQMYSGYLTLQ